ncbi:MAG: rhamnulokinase [Clostridia bacterium]|nr:rhamnulokinase [Clostridia bacterium]
MKRVLAFDFGASSGRAILGCFDGEKITLEEVHRFSNDPVSVNGVFYWDVLRLFHEIKQGLLKAKAAGGFDSVGIDTWGVDFGLLDEDGRLLENPVHYRDARTTGYIGKSAAYIAPERLYGITGIQFMECNTCFQLLSLKENRPELLKRAKHLLFMPDLLSYFLTGKMVSEYSIATTSGMIDIQKHDWSDEILSALGLERELFEPIVKTGAVIGKLSDALCEELGLPAADVIAVAGHDTQSAITAVPCAEGDFAFISSGTWSLFGTEPDAPIINETSMRYNFTNEGGYDYVTGFLKNICGLWLIQESRRQWKREGKEYSFAELEKLALESAPFACFIDPDAPQFASPGDLPGRIRDYCRQTGQHVPRTTGEVVRCIYESLAMKYRQVFAGLQDCTGKRFSQINIVGGGTKDGLLCAMAACACGVPVYAGPTEATVLGNVAMQLIAQGELPDIRSARVCIADSTALKHYAPKDEALWAAAYEAFLAATNKA